MEAICVEIPKLYGFSVSISTLSSFYSWLVVKRRLDARAALADQLKMELAKNPEISEDQIRRAGQRLFMAEGILEKDAKVFAEMVKIGQNETRLRQNDQKIDLQKKVVKLDQDKFSLMQRKARAADDAAEQMKLLKAGGTLMPDAERAAILDKMDEILGMKK